MASLTITAFYARKYIKIGAIAFVIFIILRLMFGAFVNFLHQKFPPNYFVPNHAYGVLPKIAFPQTASPSGEITFTLQTVTGTIPEASTAARVFFMPKGRAGLLSLSQAQNRVAKLGFTTTPRQLSDTLYRWVDIRSPLRTVEMDIVSNQFTLNYLYQHDLALFTERNIPTGNAATTAALNFLTQIGASLTDVDTVNPKIIYLKLVGTDLTPVSSQNDADAVQINFSRLPYDNMPIVTDNPDTANISVILSGSSRSDRQVLYAKYQYWPVDQTSQGIYKVKKASDAWLEFLAGKAYFAQFPQNQNKIPITNISLAYYDSPAAQLFMQPVFVFSGEGFTAYVPAIAPPWSE